MPPLVSRCIQINLDLYRYLLGIYKKTQFNECCFYAQSSATQIAQFQQVETASFPSSCFIFKSELIADFRHSNNFFFTIEHNILNIEPVWKSKMFWKSKVRKQHLFASSIFSWIYNSPANAFLPIKSIWMSIQLQKV